MTATKAARFDRFACLFLALWGMLGCVQAAIAEDPPLSLTIRAMATELVVGEPIVLEVTLKNTGEEVVEINPNLSRRGLSPAEFFITKDGGERRRLADEAIVCGISGTRTLQAAESFVHTEWLHVDYYASDIYSDSLALVTPDPGKYTLHVIYGTSTGPDRSVHWRVRSNDVEINIRDPKANSAPLLPSLKDAAVARSIDSGPLRGMWFDRNRYLGTDYGEVLIRRDELLGTLAESDTPYAPYAGLIRGAIELGEYDGSLRGAALAADIEARALRALEYLEPADIGGFPLQSEVVWYIREAAVLLGDEAAVQRLTKRLETEFADTQAASRPIQSKKYMP
ncbi:MAG: hypothetical protein ACF8MJ_03320 [Phycisphaerales bacterium JB050]